MSEGTVSALGNRPHHSAVFDVMGDLLPGQVAEVRTSGSTWWIVRTTSSFATRGKVRGIMIHTDSRKWGNADRGPTQYEVDREIRLDDTVSMGRGGGTTRPVTSVTVDGHRVLG